MSNRPAYPDPKSGVLFVNKIVGLVRNAIVTHPISDDDFDDATKAHLVDLLKMHAPKDEDEPPAARPREARGSPRRRRSPPPPPRPKRSASATPRPSPRLRRREPRRGRPRP